MALLCTQVVYAMTGRLHMLSPAEQSAPSFRTADSLGVAPAPADETRPTGSMAVLSPAAESGASFQTAHSFDAGAEALGNFRCGTSLLILNSNLDSAAIHCCQHAKQACYPQKGMSFLPASLLCYSPSHSILLYQQLQSMRIPR